MKRTTIIICLALFAAVDLAQACNTQNTQLLVAHRRVAPPSNPGGRPPPPADGSVARPFSSLAEAYKAGETRDFCQIRLKLENGIYAELLFATRNLEIVGTDRASTRIQGGIIASGNFELKLTDVSIVNANARAIFKQGGTINFNRVSVLHYAFAPSLFLNRPAAVELFGTQGTIVGLEVLNGDQPALYIRDAASRVKIFGSSFIGNHTSAHADTSEVVAKYAGAVEIADGALANLLVSNVRNNQYVGVLVRTGAQLLLVNSGIEQINASAGFTTTVGPDGLLAAGNSIVEMKNFVVQNVQRAGILLSNSWLTGHNGTVKNSKYGLVNRNGDIDGKNDYDTFKCATNDNVALTENETNYLPDAGNLPVPNQPLPLPCPPGQSCPTPAPPPEPPLVCKTVQLL